MKRDLASDKPLLSSNQPDNWFNAGVLSSAKPAPNLKMKTKREGSPPLRVGSSNSSNPVKIIKKNKKRKIIALTDDDSMPAQKR